MPLKGSKKKGYNKKYYEEHKEKIADKKKADYRENLEKSREDSSKPGKLSKDPKKSC